ncbi:unnamed protein product [Gordionus sp. m RMFG-2023]
MTLLTLHHHIIQNECILTDRQCSPCDATKCISPMQCLYGFVPDPCYCCMQCAKGLGDICGGIMEERGICAENLICKVIPKSTLEGPKVGVCLNDTNNFLLSLIKDITESGDARDKFILSRGTFYSIISAWNVTKVFLGYGKIFQLSLLCSEFILL